jgi:hypothetical protein
MKYVIIGIFRKEGNYSEKLKIRAWSFIYIGFFL